MSARSESSCSRVRSRRNALGLSQTRSSRKALKGSGWRLIARRMGSCAGNRPLKAPCWLSRATRSVARKVPCSSCKKKKDRLPMRE